MGTIGASIARIYGATRQAVEIATWSLTGLLVVVVTANVFARYVLEIGILWIEEISRLAFVWVVFLGAYVALCRKGHMAISMMLKRVPEGARPAILALTRVLVLVFLGTLAWAGIELVRMTMQFGRMSPILGISAAWGYASVPVASALMFVEVLRELIAGEVPPLDEAEISATAEPS